MEAVRNNCQSCGVPLKRDPRGGGSNADGSTSKIYCSRCYEAGRFKHPELTVDQMKERVKGKLQEKGFPTFMAGFFIQRIPKLARWK